MNHVEPVERKLLEARLRSVSAKENRAWLRKIGSNRFDLMAAFRERNKFAPLRPGDSSMDAGEKGGIGY